MTQRKPLVIVNGQIQQLQNGDTLDASVNEVDVVSMENGNAAALVIGTPVYVKADGTLDKAQANASLTADVLGFVSDVSIDAAASGKVQTDGILSATTAQWDAVAGTTGGLVPGSQYYLDPAVAGKITSAPPSDAGEYVSRIGRAVSSTQIEITMYQPVLL